MSTTVAVNTFTHTATYIAAKMMLTLKEIVRESGLRPENLATDWKSLEGAVAFYLRAQQLRRIVLEVYPANKPTELAGAWELHVKYSTNDSGDGGTFWADTDLIRYSIEKAGAYLSTCGYHFIVCVTPGSPDYDGWGPATLLPTDTFKRHSVGAQIGAPGASVETFYWVKS